jgi:hypothetical protein
VYASSHAAVIEVYGCSAGITELIHTFHSAHLICVQLLTGERVDFPLLSCTSYTYAAEHFALYCKELVTGSVRFFHVLCAEQSTALLVSYTAEHL